MASCNISLNDNNGLTVVLPKKGRLSEDFGRVLGDAGLAMKKAGTRVDYGTLTDRKRQLPALQVLIQRPMDALLSIADGVADLAIVGRDTLGEFNAASANRGEDSSMQVIAELGGVSMCSLCIAGPPELTLNHEEGLQGLRFATSYPETLKQWLGARGITSGRIIVRDGGVEDTVRQGLADVILDVVQTGESLRENGLEEKFVLGESNAVLVRKAAPLSAQKSALAAALADRLEAAVLPKTRETRIPVLA